MPKRFRKPVLKSGELRVYWGKEPHDNPDVMLAWQGDGGMRADTRLLYYYLCAQHPDPAAQPLFSKMKPSLIQELEARGYDITTLRFSIMKKQPLPAPPTPQDPPIAALATNTPKETT